VRRVAFAAMLLAAIGAGAATITEREVTVTVEGAAVIESERIVVLLDDPGDIEAWSDYPVVVSGLSELVECTAEVLDSTGEVVDKVPRKRHHRLESPTCELYSSDWVNIVPFPPLVLGQILRIVVVQRSTPVFPSVTVMLADDSPQRHLRVEVRGDRLRWHVGPPDERLAVQGSPQKLVVEAHDLPAFVVPEHAPGRDLVFPVLRVAWGEAADWVGIGRWYEGLLASAPAGGAGVAELARSLCEGIDDPRQRLEALTTHVQRKVRYEAVEIGQGGWVPKPPNEVIARGWGDCKDKSRLLVGLLAEVGISAHMVLIRAGAGGRVPVDLATPFTFNHCIVAVTADAAGARSGDPVVGGLLVVDPTSALGGAGWLPASDQGRPALVVDGAATRWLEIPDLYPVENRLLNIEGEIGEDGELAATLEVRLTGDRALGWIESLRSEPHERIGEAVQRLVTGAVPGCTVDSMEWSELDISVPGVLLSARIRMTNAVRGEEGGRWLHAPALGAVPDAGLVDQRSVPVVLPSGVHLTRWVLKLPEGWCGPLPQDEVIDTKVGRMRLQVGLDEAGRVLVERRSELHRSWIAEDDFEALRSLAVAESRSDRRRVRLRCPG